MKGQDIGCSTTRRRIETLTYAVPGPTMSEARIAAISCDAFVTIVARGFPFQFTTDPETKPLPFTVSVNPCPPGATASSTSGRLIRGTGLDCTANIALLRITNK